MYSLIDLPTELLIMVLEEVGGRELRRGRGAARLTVCRKWYHIAQPIYISGLNVGKIGVYGSTISKLDSEYGHSGFRKFMHKNTRNLRLRLMGHWWDQKTALHLENGGEAGDADSPGDAEPLCPFFEPEGKKAMWLWRDNELRPRLDELFWDLRHFSVLENLVVETSSESSMEADVAPRWDYIYHSTISRLLYNVSFLQDLSSLTLDICGTNLIGAEKGDHLCETLATIIPRVEHVRLRMRKMCPTIFRTQGVKPEDLKIRTLVLKLHLPMFRDAVNLWTDPCFQMPGPRRCGRLYLAMARASQSFLAELALMRRNVPASPAPRAGNKSKSASQKVACHGMTGFRMTYTDSRSPALSTLDCLTMRRLFFGEEFFAHEDEGAPCWFELGPESERLLDGGEFAFGLA